VDECKPLRRGSVDGFEDFNPAAALHAHAKSCAGRAGQISIATS